ncbi:DeoR/GlpR family DNA-binding transcription regulator [Sneathiella glossodoripedis]|uniref:DeoR/GlpR family DNA-binding transcription regulator n=1 Tax=Sneathiella glossodoripedis TaxID=418853 RepID=UPI000A6EF89E|nr:DeoR/GlpR family DNA-binding transcription regulator [Sneathiella glossodoripedis]
MNSATQMAQPIQPGNHREKEILEQLRLEGGSCRIQVLAERLGVSEETIRRNVKALAAVGAVRKVHGGVYLSESHIEQPFNTRMVENAKAKQKIARKMAEIIKSGDTLFLDVGSTTAYIANHLQNHTDLFVVTNSISVAHALAARNNNRVFMAGGELRGHDAGAFGPEAFEFIRQFKVQYAILSVAAINATDGFMVHDIHEATFSREISKRSRIRIVAADSAKFNGNAPVILNDFTSFDMLVTEKSPEHELKQALKNNDVELVLSD